MMKKNVKMICSLVLATTVALTSIPVCAEEADEYVSEVEVSEDEMADEDSATIEEVLEISNDISEEDIETLEENTTVVTDMLGRATTFSLEDTDVFGIEAYIDQNTEILVDAYSEYYTATAMANFAGLGYYSDGQGPISVVEATLYDGNGNESNVYLIGLSGTQFVKGQATGVVTDILAGFNLNNPYNQAVISMIQNNIPAGSKIMLVGHSLGGMVAQEIAGEKAIKNNYEVMNVVTFGAPLINGLNREGCIKRLGDTSDFIPYLSARGIVNPIRAIGGLNREDGNYGGIINGWTAHMNSYARLEVWGDYDVLGFKNGSASIAFDATQVKYYAAPSFIK